MFKEIESRHLHFVSFILEISIMQENVHFFNVPLPRFRTDSCDFVGNPAGWSVQSVHSYTDRYKCRRHHILDYGEHNCLIN